eukprot:TRINITY_DN6607_c0_g2_i1.p3 TRINITY_DN6607_c0_g2~~TRINITY_DN6607_c0_g2_i1.p3  ORF type:complete len:106 (-),score=6.90 TRINITY_DN6607_c0_g2_i1:52-369(-)
MAAWPFPLKLFRSGMSSRPISLLAGQWPTKATTGRWSERTITHTGTETLPGLLREAAVENLPVSYTHLTLPTILLVQISVVAVSLKKKTDKDGRKQTHKPETYAA